MRPIQKESMIEHQFVAKMRNLNWMSVKMQGSVGWPDRMFLKHGIAFFVEFKTRNGVVSAIQEHQINLLQLKGFQVFIVRDYSDETIERITSEVFAAHIPENCEKLYAETPELSDFLRPRTRKNRDKPCNPFDPKEEAWL